MITKVLLGISLHVLLGAGGGFLMCLIGFILVEGELDLSLQWPKFALITGFYGFFGLLIGFSKSGLPELIQYKMINLMSESLVVVERCLTAIDRCLDRRVAGIRRMVLKLVNKLRR